MKALMLDEPRNATAVERKEKEEEELPQTRKKAGALGPGLQLPIRGRSSSQSRWMRLTTGALASAESPGAEVTHVGL